MGSVCCGAMPIAPVRASSDDRCPGALRLHAADDGYVARIRVPGGRLTAVQLASLCGLADALGDGAIHLTSRANLQVRGLSAGSGSAVATALQDAGLLPSLAHDRVRNVVASPFGGAAVEAALAAFDRALVADDRLVALSGRFLFGIDDGTGDIVSLRPDLTAVPHRDGWQLLVDGRPSDLVGPASHVLIDGAHRFLDVREAHAPTAWRVSDLGKYVGALSTSDGSAENRVSTSDGSAKHGEQFLEAWVPLGVASTDAWRAVAELADRLRITPWRSVVLVDPDDHDQARITLQHSGFLLSAAEPLARTTACIGRPGCASALTDVRRDALQLAGQLAGQHAGRLHVSGCERRCGHPRGVRAEATAQPGGGYLIELIEELT
jgi:precorrin-3B synthase